MPDTGFGLYSGFEGYRTPGDDDYATLVREGVVAVDTNVLLNLYKFGTAPRKEFLEGLERIADRLFVPHQVVAEFWRNRVQVLEDQQGHGGAHSELQKGFAAVLRALSRWELRCHAGAEGAAMRSQVQLLQQDVEGRMRDSGGQIDVEVAILDSREDPVLAALQPLLAGAVGPPFSPDEHALLVKQGRQRFDRQVPPGFLDAGKTGQDEAGTGDYLLWEQVLRHAESSDRDVLLVTLDTKADWWQHDRSQRLIGPRVELVEEFRARTGRRLLLMLPSRFLEVAAEVYGMRLSAHTLEDVQRLTDPVEDGREWDEGMVQVLLLRLRQSHLDLEADVVDEASRSGGSISRDRVLELGGLEGDHVFRTFTAPVTRTLRDLVTEGELPPGLEHPLWSEYEGSSKRATSFRVPESMVLARRQDRRTWLEAAEEVMHGSERAWTVAELVSEAGRRGLRDLSRAQTPQDTLRRDLRHRADQRFQQDEHGRWLLRRPAGEA